MAGSQPPPASVSSGMANSLYRRKAILEDQLDAGTISAEERKQLEKIRKALAAYEAKTKGTQAQ